MMFLVVMKWLSFLVVLCCTPTESARTDSAVKTAINYGETTNNDNSYYGDTGVGTTNNDNSYYGESGLSGSKSYAKVNNANNSLVLRPRKKKIKGIEKEKGDKDKKKKQKQSKDECQHNKNRNNNNKKCRKNKERKKKIKNNQTLLSVQETTRLTNESSVDIPRISSSALHPSISPSSVMTDTLSLRRSINGAAILVNSLEMIIPSKSLVMSVATTTAEKPPDSSIEPITVYKESPEIHQATYLPVTDSTSDLVTIVTDSQTTFEPITEIFPSKEATSSPTTFKPITETIPSEESTSSPTIFKPITETLPSEESTSSPTTFKPITETLPSEETTSSPTTFEPITDIVSSEEATSEQPVIDFQTTFVPVTDVLPSEEASKQTQATDSQSKSNSITNKLKPELQQSRNGLLPSSHTSGNKLPKNSSSSISKKKLKSKKIYLTSSSSSIVTARAASRNFNSIFSKINQQKQSKITNSDSKSPIAPTKANQIIYTATRTHNTVTLQSTMTRPEHSAGKQLHLLTTTTKGTSTATTGTEKPEEDESCELKSGSQHDHLPKSCYDGVYEDLYKEVCELIFRGRIQGRANGARVPSLNILMVEIGKILGGNPGIIGEIFEKRILSTPLSNILNTHLIL